MQIANFAHERQQTDEVNRAHLSKYSIKISALKGRVYYAITMIQRNLIFGSMHCVNHLANRNLYKDGMRQKHDWHLQ
jgi:hypothetical protein